MKMCGTVVISVISSQNGREASNDISTLFMEISNTVVINVITRQNRNMVSSHIWTLFMEVYGTVSTTILLSKPICPESYSALRRKKLQKIDLNSEGVAKFILNYLSHISFRVEVCA